MTIPVDKLRRYYQEWLAKRDTLEGQEYKHFHRWLARACPDLFTPYIGEPAVFVQQCRQLQRSARTKKQRGKRRR